ncbi:hypothetical protein [Yoonia sp. SS1-5]|uniref:Glycoside hydrolase family 104 protein n=1 Tax=Yoonia rhodophyticola TaxID=3137370 RepID=A0AAN0MAI7_9RHOB
MRAMAGPQLGQILHKPLILHEKVRPGQRDDPHNRSNSLISLRNTALQPWLRMVCLFPSPARAKQPVVRRFARRARSAASFLRMGIWGSIAAAMLALPASAQEWQSVSATAGWSNADRFTAEVPQSGPAVPRGDFATFLGTLRGGELDQLMAFIGRAESPRLGYDSVQHRARIRPPHKPTDMTLGQIFTWIKETPGQHHAIGRYQVIPDTLAYVSRELGFEATTRYDRRTQDLIGTFLIREAGYQDFRAGRLSRGRFMDNLAKIWAGLPTANGRSHYHGFAGNRATVTRAEFEQVMGVIFPLRRASND